MSTQKQLCRLGCLTKKWFNLRKRLSGPWDKGTLEFNKVVFTFSLSCSNALCVSFRPDILYIKCISFLKHLQRWFLEEFETYILHSPSLVRSNLPCMLEPPTVKQWNSMKPSAGLYVTLTLCTCARCYKIGSLLKT